MDSENQNFEKILKKAWRYYHFTHVYHKLQTYHGLFLRYQGKHDRHNFLSFGPFFPFYPPNNLKNQNFEKIKETPGEIIIYTGVT